MFICTDFTNSNITKDRKHFFPSYLAKKKSIEDLIPKKQNN